MVVDSGFAPSFRARRASRGPEVSMDRVSFSDIQGISAVTSGFTPCLVGCSLQDPCGVIRGGAKVSCLFYIDPRGLALLDELSG
jgi:hypothetical protein